LPFFIPFDDHLLNSNLSLVIMATAAAASARVILNWIAEHPYQTAFHVANGVILVTPAAATVPIFSAMGFSATGPVAGK
jgi:ammonia channel protein AmtB